MAKDIPGQAGGRGEDEPGALDHLSDEDCRKELEAIWRALGGHMDRVKMCPRCGFADPDGKVSGKLSALAAENAALRERVGRLDGIIARSFMLLPVVPEWDGAFDGSNLEPHVRAVADEFSVLTAQVAALESRAADAEKACALAVQQRERVEGEMIDMKAKLTAAEAARDEAERLLQDVVDRYDDLDPGGCVGSAMEDQIEAARAYLEGRRGVPAAQRHAESRLGEGGGE